MRLLQCVSCFLGLILIAGCGDGRNGSTDRAVNLVVPDNPEAAIITVNGKKLTVAQAMKRTDQRLAARYSKLNEEQRAGLRTKVFDSVLNQFVMHTLLLDEAERRGIVITDEEVSAQIERLEDSLQSYGKDIDEIGKNGPRESGAIREEMTSLLTIRRLWEQVVPETEASDDDIATFKRENRNGVPMPETISAQHILVKLDKDDDETIRREKRLTAEHVRRQLLAGADFASMAARFSDCPSKQSGGKLGNLHRGIMARAFDRAAFSQEVGAIGNVVTSRHGYHVILVDRHDPSKLVHPDRLPTKFLKPATAAYMRKKAKDELLVRLQKEATITYAEPKKR